MIFSSPFHLDLPSHLSHHEDLVSPGETKNKKTCQPGIVQLEHMEGARTRRSHGVIQGVRWSRGIRECRRNRCRCTPGPDSSPHPSDKHIWEHQIIKLIQFYQAVSAKKLHLISKDAHPETTDF